LTNGSADFQAVFAGNHDVEDEESRALAFGVRENICACRIDADGEAFVLEMMTDQAGNVGIVFDYEETWFHGIIVAKAVAGT
jgi:hypothetical protein